MSPRHGVGQNPESEASDTPVESRLGISLDQSQAVSAPAQDVLGEESALSLERFVEPPNVCSLKSVKAALANERQVRELEAEMVVRFPIEIGRLQSKRAVLGSHLEGWYVEEKAVDAAVNGLVGRSKRCVRSYEQPLEVSL